VKYFTVSADEVTTIDNGTWMSITIYYVDDWGWELMMCALEHVKEGMTSNNLTKVIMKAVQVLTIMLKEEIAKRMIAFGTGEFLDSCMNDFEFQFDCFWAYLCTNNVYGCWPDGVNVFQGANTGWFTSCKRIGVFA
jgi:hypothetical protein